MEDMIEIARLISTYGLKTMDTRFTGKDNTKLTAFYEGLVNGTIYDDESASRLLYTSKPTDLRYRTLKSRLREKLYAASIFIDFPPPDYSELRQKMYECVRELNAMKLCIENGAQLAGATIAKRLLVKSRIYHLTIIEIECLYALLNHIAYCVGSEIEFQQISAELQYANQKLNAESKAEIIFASVSVKYSLISSDHPENAPLFEEAIAKLQELLQQFDTFKIRYNYYFLRSWHGQVQRKFAERIKACDEAIEYYTNNPRIAGNLVAVFTAEKAESYFHLREYSAFLNLSEKSDTKLDKNTSNWLIIKCFEIQTLLSMGLPLKAWHVFESARKNLKRSSGGILKIVERWLILEGYILFFLHTNVTGNSAETAELPPIEPYLRKLITSELTSSTSDKEGANVGMFILHILLLLCLRSNPADLAEKVVALDRYKRRNLDKKSNQRTETFVSMLRHFIFDKFDIHTTTIKNKELYMMLAPSTATTIDTTEDYELIPFDIIWNQLMKFYGAETMTTL